jgi:hypothetical protein
MIKSIQLTKKGSEHHQNNELMYTTTDAWNSDGSNLLVYVNDQIKRINVDYTINSPNSLLFKNKPENSDTIIFYITNLSDPGSIFDYDERMQQLDKISKKLDGKAQSSIKKRADEETMVSHLMVHSDNVWVSPIPQKASLALKNGIAIYRRQIVLLEDVTVSGHKGWYASTTANDSGLIKNWIPPEFGNDYIVRLYDNSGAEISSSDAMRWHFDYQSGYLTIENNFTYAYPFLLTGYEYTGKRGVGSGSYWKEPVFAKTELPTSNNEDGDMRLVLATNKVYKYDSIQVRWEELEYGSSQYKDPVETFADMPTRGNKYGDIRFVLDEKNLYMWSGTEWLILTGQGYDPNNFYSKSVMDELLRDKSGTSHTHDTIYYRKEYVDSITRWRVSVATEDNLPPYTENEDGDVILTRDNNSLYRWYSDNPTTGQGHWENILQATYSWKTPVPTKNDLPQIGNTFNDCRIVSDEGTIYFYDGVEWQVIKSSMQFDGAAYVQKSNLSWKEPVSELPTVGNNLNDIRLLTSDNKLYKWNGLTWSSISGSNTIITDSGQEIEVTSGYLLNPVNTVVDLPTGVEIGSIVFINELNALYSYDGTIWKPITLEADNYYTKTQIDELVNQAKLHVNYNDLLNIPLFFWNKPVAQFSELIPVNNKIGDVKLVIENKSLYVWNGSIWDLMFSGEFLLNHAHDYSTVYYTIEDINGIIENIGQQLNQKAAIFHSHDEYYVKEQIEEFLSGKSDLTHIHDEYALINHQHPEIITGLKTANSGINVDWTNLLNIPNISSVWKEPVGVEIDLPITDDVGAIRMVLKDYSVWRYSGSAWVKLGSANISNSSWKSSVNLVSLLPLNNNINGDVRLVEENNTLYTWQNGSWFPLNDVQLKETPSLTNEQIFVYKNGVKLEEHSEWEWSSFSSIHINSVVNTDIITVSQLGKTIKTSNHLGNNEIYGVKNDSAFYKTVIVLDKNTDVVDLPFNFSTTKHNVLIWINGKLQCLNKHYTETTTSKLTFTSQLIIGARLEIVMVNLFTNDTFLRKDITNSTAQLFNTTQNYTIGSQQLMIYKNGSLLYNGYSEETDNSFRLITPLIASDYLVFVIIQPLSEIDQNLIAEHIKLGNVKKYEGLIKLSPNDSVASIIENINSAAFLLMPNDVLTMNEISWYNNELKLYQGYVALNANRESGLAYYDYIVKDDYVTLYHNGYFSNADNGILELLINGNLVDSFNLGTAFVASDYEKQVNTRYGRLIGGAAQNVGIINTACLRSSDGGKIDIIEISKNIQKDLQKGKIQLNLANLSQGYNEIKIVHRLDTAVLTSKAFKIFVDSNHQPISFIQDFNIEGSALVSNKWLSGIRYYSIGDQMLIKFKSTSFAQLSYSYNPFSISFPATTDINYTADNLYAELECNYNNNAVIDTANIYDINARGIMTIKDFFEEPRTVESLSNNLLLNTVVQQSTVLTEYFTDEMYRLPVDDYNSTINVRTGLWKSDSSLKDGNALIFNKSLMYANLNTINLQPLQNNNYSGFTKEQIYIRSFVYSEPRNNCIFVIDGITLNDLFENKLSIYVKLPTVTGWLLLNKYYNTVTFTGQDNDGCLTDNIGNQFFASFGKNSTISSNYTIVIKIVLNKTSPRITYLECKFKE